MMEFIRLSQPANLTLLLGILPLLYYFHRQDRTSAGLPKIGIWRARLPLILRVSAAILLVLAISGIQSLRGKSGTAVVFVLDRSESVSQKEAAAALDYVKRTIPELAPGDRVGIVVFGREALIECPIGKDLPPTEIQSTPGSTSTNIASGLALARSMLEGRPEIRKQMVLFSDGNQNSGDALQEVILAATRGIALDVLPLSTAAEMDSGGFHIQEITGPERVKLEEPFDIKVAVRAPPGHDAILSLYRDGILVSEKRERLEVQGNNVFHFQDRVGEAGFRQYRAAIRPADEGAGLDFGAVGDEAGLVVYAYGRTRVLHLSVDPSPFLDEILKTQGFEVVASAPTSAPETEQALSSYDVVVLDGAPASLFSADQMRALAENVEKHGSGLIMVGGRGSFGPGGYVGTPVEKVLPVEMSLKKREKKPGLAIMLVLDKSGSMGIEQRKVSKIEMAKDAVLQLSELMAPEDALGIIAFDQVSQEVLPLTQGIDRTIVEGGVRSLAAGSGTAILPAVEMAYKSLAGSEAERKYILLLSDGQALQEERKPLMDRVSGSRVVLSAVGVGADVDREFMQGLAETGHGRAYFTQSGTDLPDIFKREGMLISGKWLVERRFMPKMSSDHEILGSLGKSGFPRMTGYVATTAKDLSEVLITSDSRDPILACWRTGLGKALVFTSDFSSSWTRELTSWREFGRLWAQMVRWASRDLENLNFHPRVKLENEFAVLAMDVFDGAGKFMNFLKSDARVQTPDLITTDIDMIQTAPGHYEGRLGLRGKGNYYFSVAARGEKSQAEDSLHFGFAFTKSAENSPLRADREFLAALAASGNGRVLMRDSAPSSPPALGSSYADAWQTAVILSIFLFLLEIAVRRGSGKSPRPESTNRGRRQGNSIAGG